MSDISSRAEFSFIRYSQCWEDADTLLEALLPKPGGHYISIASGGENSFSLISRGARVTAIDLSLPQLAVTDLKRAAYIALSYDEFLAFLGVTEMDSRCELYRSTLRPLIKPEHRVWLDNNLVSVEGGIIHSGKFEQYFKTFRTKMLPLVHKKEPVEALLMGNPDRAAREEFHDKCWNSVRYRMMFQIFFSRFVMGSRGRDAAFFEHVEGRVADRIKQRVRTGLVEVNGTENPYLNYILTGNYREALPHAFRPEVFDSIKANISNLTLCLASVEDALDEIPDESVAGYNLSDIFEYMSNEQMDKLYEGLLDKAGPGARIVYWNMLVSRAANRERFSGRFRGYYKTGANLLKTDKAFFYKRLIIEEKR